MEVVRRIVSALLAAAVFPAVLFLDFIYVKISPTFADIAVEESITVARLLDIVQGKDPVSKWFGFGEAGTSVSWPQALDPIKPALICFAVFFALAVITAVFVIIWSAVSKNRLGVFCGGLAGAAFTVASKIAFTRAAAPLLAGSINVGTMFSEGWLASMIGEVVSVDALAFAAVPIGMMILYIGIALWTGMFWLSELGESPEDRASQSKKKAKRKA